MSITPTPYPSKPKFQSIGNTSNSYPTQIAALKKEISSLETKILSLTKINQKLDKKTKEQGEDIKKLKQNNVSLSSDNLILQKSLQKISAEKLSLEEQIKDNKKYITKIENKLINGASNQYLNEQITNLKNEKELMNEEIEHLNKTIEKISKEKEHYEDEIKILNKAVELKLNEVVTSLKEKNIKVNKDTLLNIGIQKEEKEKILSSINTMQTELDRLKIVIKEKDDKIKELIFAKNHLTEMLVEKDTFVNNFNQQKDEMTGTINQLISERDLLRDCIEKANIQQKAIENDVKFEATEYQNKIKELQKELIEVNQKNIEASTQVDILNKTIEILKDKNTNLEASYKSNAIKVAELETTKNNIDVLYQQAKSENENSKLEVITLNKKINELNEQMHKLEEENIQILSKLKTTTIEGENIRVDLVKQNMILSQNESKLKNQVTKSQEEIDKLKKEKEDYKRLLSEMNVRREELTKEKDEKETEPSNHIMTLQNNNNMLLLTRRTEENYAKTEADTLSEEKKKKSMNIMDLIKKEKEKNNSVMEEIRRVKAALANN